MIISLPLPFTGDSSEVETDQTSLVEITPQIREIEGEDSGLRGALDSDGPGDPSYDANDRLPLLDDLPTAIPPGERVQQGHGCVILARNGQTSSIDQNNCCHELEICRKTDLPVLVVQIRALGVFH